MIHPTSGNIHPAPFIRVLRGYKRSFLRGDVMAGLTVAIFAVPQAIAYGMLAEVDPIHGLYAAMVASIVAALWGSAPFVNTGPTNSASLLTAAAMFPMMTLVVPEYHMQMVFLFTLLVGIIRMTMGLLRMGGLIHFVPESAFLGFTMGVGSMIALGRLHHLLGIDKGEETWFPSQVVDKLGRITEADPHAVAVSALTLGIMFGLNKYGKRFPVALLAMGAGIAYAYWMPGCQIILVQDISPVPTGLPTPVSPFFEGWAQHIPALLPGALAVSVVGLIEAVSIGQTLAVRHRMRLNFNQEFFGQGLGMIASSFFQGIPGSGSFSRSTLIEESGGVTFVANVIFGLATALALITLPGLINLIPAASLAGLLLFIGVRLIDPKRVKRLWRTSRIDVGVMIATLLVTVFIRIEYGIFTGIILAAMLLLQRSRSLHLKEILPQPDGSFEERPYTPGSQHEQSSLVGLSLHGDLSYTVAHELLEQLNEITQIQDPEVIILRIRQTHAIDFSSWNAILDFSESFQKNGRKVYLTGIDDSTRKTIRDARAHKWLPDEQLFVGTPVLMESFRQAIRQAAENLTDTQRISGVWKDWLENPVVISREQLSDIQKFLNGESLDG
ncbi:SulP family inorganic anion transporter [Kiritimatiellaeota bacterium B1221]|nr:SulP family inorganic anion transporter [Kiritimatiellaeota bacterium B1221]